MDLKKEALELHEKNRGKLEVKAKVSVATREDLSLAYSPGVAEPCKEIAKDVNNVYKYTMKGNTVGVITDGTAVLGLGDIGPEAALPVMEGKALLFKGFAGVDAIPICLDTKDTEEIIRTCKLLAPGLGGINLEDISAPRCVEIERRLKKELDIPVFHDDQHGTAIVVVAGLINAYKLLGKDLKNSKVVVLGAGAAGSSIIKLLNEIGVGDILALDRQGIIAMDDPKREYNFLTEELAEETNKHNITGDLERAMEDSDIFIGVSGANLLKPEWIKKMKDNPVVFALANPDPEIKPELAIEAGVKIIGTGRSDYPNQINNVLAFPGLFKGALEAKAKKITEEMKLAAAKGIAGLIKEEELREDYIIPDPFDKRVVDEVSKIVMETARAQGICRDN